MDLPLYSYGRRRLHDDGSCFGDDSTHKRVKRALKYDNKDDFVKFVNRYSVKDLEDELPTLRVFMLTDHAAKCAAAVLDEETQISDITDLLTCNPLHCCVGFGSVVITALLLERGFSADVRCHYDSSLPHVLPLGVALHELRQIRGLFLPENERTCAVKFTIDLFRDLTLPGLETVRLLSMKTRDIKHEFFNYLKEGKMVEVGALLFVARARILSSSTGKGKFSSILEMQDFLSEEITSYTNSKRLLSAADDKLIEMEQTLVLLQIFDTIGDKLEALIRQDLSHCSSRRHKTFVAASLLGDAGFDVNVADIPTRKLARIEIRGHKNFNWVNVDDDCVKKTFTTVRTPNLPYCLN